ncbi:hypothetical protein [Helicobacter cetorum]|uniref:hypothetical protein n=1 Tax=Helicobacter cetorum TaxID=138563 RepID=UPI0012DE7AF1|nr:hypothetical protein [Helicobacter cetorum]
MTQENFKQAIQSLELKHKVKILREFNAYSDCSEYPDCDADANDGWACRDSKGHCSD